MSYKCERCKGQVEEGIPQPKIRQYREDGQIKKEEKVCWYCKNKEDKKNEKKKR